jgi:aspartate/methionine/tyrosine aminotransferase
MNIAPFKLERYFANYEFAVDYLLCSSDSESLTIADVLALEPGTNERFQQHWLGYTESPGSPLLRQEICGIYQTMEPAHILVHTGAEEAIFLFMQAVLAAGDHIIVHWPCYQSLVEVARSMGCEVSLWQARESANWALDIDQLKGHLRANTKAIIINTPHNPTGYLMPPDTFQQVNDMAQANGLLLFSDEVYRESEYQIKDRLPAAGDMGEHAVSLGVMSKTYGLAGLRIGWIATRNQPVYAKMAALKDYTTICNSAPSEFLAQVALRYRERLVKRNLQIIGRNLPILENFFARHAGRFVWQKPKAGSIAFPRLLGDDIEQFCDRLVKTTGVLLLPGTLYDDHDNHFRIGIGRQNMPEAVQRLEEFLQKSGV